MVRITVEENNQIDEFINIVSQDKSVDLSNFHKNLKSVKVYELTEEEMSKRNCGSGDAAYEYVENEIYITPKSKKIKSAFHELFHMASTTRNNSIVHNGFLCCNLDNEEYIGRGLNEGYTELLTERYFDLGTDYHYERMLARQIEKIVGEQFLKDNYFNPNLDAIINKLASYSSESETKNFIQAFDDYVCYRTVMEDRKVESLQDLMYQCCKYLFHAYISKLQTEQYDADNKLLLFNSFINDFDFGYIIYEGYGKVDMHAIIKKIGEDSGMFELPNNPKLNNHK